MSTRDDPFLTGDQRQALHAELFAHWNAREPDTFHCFAGSDADLVALVRAERGEHDPEPDAGSAADRDPE